MTQKYDPYNFPNISRKVEPEPEMPEVIYLIENKEFDEDDDHRIIWTTDIDVYPESNPVKYIQADKIADNDTKHMLDLATAELIVYRKMADYLERAALDVMKNHAIPIGETRISFVRLSESLSAYNKFKEGQK